jgi:rubrerythrin
MGWSLDNIAWQRFDPSRVEPATMKVMKAAALIEINGEIYATYLANVFKDDAEFCALLQDWAVDERRHGQALRRWAELADPSFDFEAVHRDYMAGSHFELETTESVFGSRSPTRPKSRCCRRSVASSRPTSCGTTSCSTNS